MKIKRNRKPSRRARTIKGYVLTPGAFEKIMAVEGLYLDDEQKAMFAEFDRLKLSPAERRKRIIARYGRKPK